MNERGAIPGLEEADSMTPGEAFHAGRRYERGRCAKIAEEIADQTGDGEGEIYIARKIANAIRAGKLD